MGLKAAHAAGASEGVICSTDNELTVDLKFAIFFHKKTSRSFHKERQRLQTKYIWVG